MKKIVDIALFIICLLSSPFDAFAYTVVATDTHSGEYEDGKFKSDTTRYLIRYEIDENKGIIKKTELIHLSMNPSEIIKDSTTYAIINIDEGKPDVSSVLENIDKKNQRIITAVEKAGINAVEMITIGENFFYYCKSGAGRLYISYGTVARE